MRDILAMIIIGIIALIGLFAIIAVLSQYGNTPVGELPTWAWWLLH